ncbi:MAG TPA: TIGR03564 family F420-dependent LLM class oxidoreductase [Acidimicrobiales bacterium]|jgi:F420-dependent oxidoreductase-like protein
MRIGIYGGREYEKGLDAVLAAAGLAEEQGFATYWLPQIFGPDALTTLAIVGREVPRIELGTSVVPTWPRHPMVLAAQALTTQAATGGRLTLGIGLSHQPVVEGMWGYRFDRPVRHMGEYLTALVPLVREGSASVQGETITAQGSVRVEGADPVPVLVAALGPKMLDLAGRAADGTITWMTGPRTLRDLTVPTITAAAERAGRPAPAVVASLPVCVTDDVAGARERAATIYAVYGQLPSYRAMLDREGADGPADVALVGDEAALRERLEELEAAGVTDFAASEFAGGDDRDRTRAFLRGLLTPDPD